SPASSSASRFAVSSAGGSIMYRTKRSFRRRSGISAADPACTTADLGSGGGSPSFANGPGARTEHHPPEHTPRNHPGGARNRTWAYVSTPSSGKRRQRGAQQV